MSTYLPTSLGMALNDPKAYLEFRKHVISLTTSTKTGPAIGTIAEGIVPAFMLNSMLVHHNSARRVLVSTSAHKMLTQGRLQTQLLQTIHRRRRRGI